MKITNVHTENTGGGCMVTYIDVEDCDDVAQIGVDEEAICTFTTRYQDTEDCMAEHSKSVFYSEEDLRSGFSDEETEDILQVLYAYCRRFDLRPGFQLSKNNLEKFMLSHIKSASKSAEDLQIITFLEAIDSDSYLDAVISLEPTGPALALALCELDKDTLRKLLIDVLFSRYY